MKKIKSDHSELTFIVYLFERGSRQQTMDNIIKKSLYETKLQNKGVRESERPGGVIHTDWLIKVLMGR